MSCGIFGGGTGNDRRCGCGRLNKGRRLSLGVGEIGAEARCRVWVLCRRLACDVEAFEGGDRSAQALLDRRGHAQCHVPSPEMSRTCEASDPPSFELRLPELKICYEVPEYLSIASTTSSHFLAPSQSLRLTAVS